MAMTLLAAVRRAAPEAVALLSPKQDMSLTYGELDDKVRRLAGGLRTLGVGRGHVVASDLPNTAENLFLQLALSHLGASFATAKDAKSLKEKVEGKVVCAVASDGHSWFADTAQLPESVKTRVVLDTAHGFDKSGHLAFSDLLQSPVDSEPAAATPEDLFASYNGAAMTQKQAVSLGQNAASVLKSTAEDRSCVSITLCHSFGFGSGVGSAFMSGGAVVLPAAGGIRGCGDPKQRAAVTAEVLATTGCSLLFADAPILKQLQGMELIGGGSKLRTGVVKVGSGTDIFDDGSGMRYAGAALLAMGKKPAA